MIDGFSHVFDRDPSRERERTEYERFSELRRLAFLSGVISYWRDTAVRNSASAKRLFDAFRHQLKYLEDEAALLRGHGTDRAILPVIDELMRAYGAGTVRDAVTEPAGMIQVRDREAVLWAELEHPERAVEEAKDTLQILDWQLRLLARYAGNDPQAFRESLVRFDDNFAHRSGTLRVSGEALARMWRRDLPRHTMPEADRGPWESLFLDYVRLHGYLYVLGHGATAPVDWKKLEALVGSAQEHARAASESIVRYEQTLKRSTAARTSAKRRVENPSAS